MKRDSDYLHFRPYRAIVASPIKRSRIRSTDEPPTPLARNVPEVLHPRSRLLYAALTVAVIGVGLLWRSPFLGLSPLLAKYGGSALWALMIFLAGGFLLPQAKTGSLALLALAFSFGIEFTQLYHAAWIDQLRATRLGALVLGSTFNWPDFTAYTFGIVAGSALDRVLPRGSAVAQRW